MTRTFILEMVYMSSSSHISTENYAYSPTSLLYRGVWLIESDVRLGLIYLIQHALTADFQGRCNCDPAA